MVCRMFCVRRKGTRSGVSRLSPWSKRQPKSTCMTEPVVLSTRMFSRWRSPSPTAMPIMDMTALERVKARRASNQADGARNVSTSHRCITGGSSSMSPCTRATSASTRRSLGSARAAAWRVLIELVEKGIWCMS